MEWSQIYTSMTSPLVPFKGPSIVHYIYCTLQESAAMFLMMKNPVGLCNPFASVMSVVNMHFNIQGPYGIYLTTLKGSPLNQCALRARIEMVSDNMLAVNNVFPAVFVTLGTAIFVVFVIIGFQLCTSLQLQYRSEISEPSNALATR